MTRTISSPGARAIEPLIDSYDRNGFAFKERILTVDQVRRAALGVEWAMTHLAGNYKWIKQRTYEWYEQHPIFVEIIQHPLVLQFARAILGDDFYLNGAQCSRNTKSEKYIDGLTTIHQDVGLFPTPEQRRAGVPDHHHSFSAMWYVQDTPLEMGPTELLRGSHLHGTTPRKNKDMEAAASGDDEDSAVFRRPIPAGSLLIFSHYTWHRGAENFTDKPRDLITNAYALGGMTRSHLMIKDAEGNLAYTPPKDLVRRFSSEMQYLLRV